MVNSNVVRGGSRVKGDIKTHGGFSNRVASFGCSALKVRQIIGVCLGSELEARSAQVSRWFGPDLLISASRISPSALCGPHGRVDAIFVCGRQVCLVRFSVDDPESIVQEGDLSFDDVLDLLVQSFAGRRDDWSVEVGFLYVAADRLGAPSADKLN